MDMAGPSPQGDRSFAGLAIDVLESIADGFLAVDRNWRIIYINLRACELLRAERDSVIGRILWERFPELLGTEAEKRLREAVTSGTPTEYEVLSPVVQRWFAMRICTMSGGFVGIYWRDVTQRREDEAALRRSNDQLLLAMEAAGFGTWEHEIAADTRHWSDQARRLIGVAPGVEPSYEIFITAIHRDDRDRVAQAFRRSHDRAQGGKYEVEYRVRGADGRERWVAGRGRTLFDADGTPLRMIGVTLDITEHKRREQALHESQERFRTMLEALPQIAFVIGTDGVAEYYNKRFAEYVGHAIGTDSAARTALHHPDDQKMLVTARMEGAASDREYTTEARMRRHDGAYRWHIIRNSPLRRDGNTVAWLGTAVDIDDMRQAQETLHRVNDELERRVAERTRDLAEANQRLRASEERTRALFWKAPVPMHALDERRRLVDVNEYWLKLYGYTRDEVIGRPIADFHAPDAGVDIHESRWREVLDRGELHDVERRFFKKSGETFDAVVSVHLETDNDGNFLRTITTTIDVTARKRAEEAARRERQVSESLIEGGTEGIIGLDNEFRYIVWNPAMEATSGVARRELLGQNLFERRRDLRGTPIEAAWRATMEGRRTTLRDWSYNFQQSGRSGYYDIDFAPLYGADRTIIGGFAFLRDTTERRQVEEQLRQSQKMEAVGQLTGGVAHDFNNLLTVIMGNLDNLRHHLPGQAEPQRMVDAIMRATSRAATLTHRLLAFARRQPLEPKAIDVNKLVSGMSDLLRRSLGEGIVIETVLAGGLWRTLADPNQLENALLNLAVNARDAMQGAGKLTIETANAFLDEGYAALNEGVTSGQYVLIAVSDTGSGMSKDVAEKAFEPFFTTKEVGQGTGLGLPQVYGFVKQSGGHVKIYTEPGEGTTLKLYLPRLLVADEPLEAVPERPPQPARTPGECVLVVEDDEDVRSYSADILRSLGYRVMEAPDGPAALRLLDGEPELRLLFTDVGLPGGLNGRQLADEAKRRRPELKVLFTTGYARNAIVHQGRLDPGVELIVKPFTASSLAAKIRQVLHGAPAKG
jgi:PAS domain S-box-containing protein